MEVETGTYNYSPTKGYSWNINATITIEDTSLDNDINEAIPLK